MTLWIKEQYLWLKKKIDSQFVQQYSNTWRTLAGFSIVVGLSHTLLQVIFMQNWGTDEIVLPNDVLNPIAILTTEKKLYPKFVLLFVQSCSHTWGALAGFSMVPSPPPPHNGQVGTKAAGWTFIQLSEEVTRIVQNVRPPARCVFVFVFVFVVCRVSVWGDSYAGQLCMCHLPLNLRLNTQSRTLGLRNEQILYLNFLYDSRLPSAALLQAFFMQKLFPCDTLGRWGKFWIATCCNLCFFACWCCWVFLTLVISLSLDAALQWGWDDIK